jgi:hypothetical protein
MAEEPAAGSAVTTRLVADQIWEHDEETGGQVAMLVDSASDTPAPPSTLDGLEDLSWSP